MKIRVTKNAMVIGVEVKMSKKGNDYGLLSIADLQGNLHKCLVQSDLMEKALTLKYKDDVVLELEITYNDKFDKIQVVDFAC